MFYDKNNRSAEAVETVIGEHCVIVGNLSGSGTLKVNGSIDGDIDWQDNVIFTQPSVHNGNLNCKNVIVSGKIIGNIICEDTLTIESSGKVIGDITIKNLIIQEGGCLDGKSTMLVDVPQIEVLE
ncbi:bactofilin family protein [Clostridium oryzae]|uniref:Polymer-forming cytoskeletal n=1 Tax=Clostridium oryzae TaxID=1450648 RepID=A0A1V4I5S3_9CLOT|nr:polymer-forming cytoskeletal protein [Clostridium oryzae]OPJ55341.1 polymer-forming cytoskeletal [Clostridium oryzae]